MAPADHNSPDVLREEILADARQQAAQIIDGARQEAEALLAKATDEAQKKRLELLDAARSEAARRTELAMLTVPVETARRRSARMETLLRSIYDAARGQLLARAGVDYREPIFMLAADAVNQMSGNAFVLRLSPQDRAALNAGFTEEVARRVGRSPLTFSLVEDPAVAEGGLIIQDAEGRQIWDNRLTARLERLWPELRRQIAVQLGFAERGTS